VAIEQTRTISPYRVSAPVTLAIILDDSPFADHVRTKLADVVQADGSLLLTGDSVVICWQRYLQAKP